VKVADVQDLIAIAVSLIAAAWLVRSLWGRFFAPPCRPPHAGPPGSDGFVPVEKVGQVSNTKGGQVSNLS
jgi:hypothetical protein